MVYAEASWTLAWSTLLGRIHTFPSSCVETHHFPMAPLVVVILVVYPDGIICYKIPPILSQISIGCHLLRCPLFILHATSMLLLDQPNHQVHHNEPKRLSLLGSRDARIVSLAQFRPEKNHQLQLEAMAALLQLYKSKSQQVPKDLELVICGAVRNLDDQAILDRLKERSNELGLGQRVRFEVNLSFSEIKQLLGSSKVCHLLYWKMV